MFIHFKKYVLPLLSTTIAITTTLVLALLYIYNVNRGYSLSDEGFYLLKGMYPDDSKSGVAVFGYYLHFIMLISHNIIFLRLFTFIVSLIIIIGLCRLFCKIYLMKIDFIELILLICTSICTFCISWMFPTTPSYNSFTVIGATLFITLCLFIFSKAERCSYISFVLFGFVVAFVFLNKFSAGIILLIFGIIICAIKGYRINKLILIFVCFILGILVHVASFFIFIQPLNIFIKQFHNGMVSMKIMDSGHDLSLISKYVGQIGDLLVYSYKKYQLIIYSLFIFKILTIVFKKLVQYQKIFLLFLLCLFFALSFHVSNDWSIERFRDIVTFYFSLIIFLSMIMLFNFDKKIFVNWSYFKVIKSILLLFFLFMPIIIAVGTNNDINMQILISIFLWMPIVFFISNEILLFTGVVFRHLLIMWLTLISAYFALFHIVEIPYGFYGNMLKQNNKININGSVLYVDDTTKYILTNTNDQLSKCGFKPSEYIVSLTDVPGLTYAVGGRSPSCPWYFGMYNGVDNFAKFCLSLSPEIKSPFILLDSYVGQQNVFSESQMGNYFSDFSQRYEQCGEVKNIPTDGGSCCKAPISSIKIYRPKIN